VYAFAMLSENYQEVVRLRIFLRLGFSEIGDLLCESAGDVRSVFQQALDIMRVTFELAQGGDVTEPIT
jgi:DNA-directed RNA polymerase specialized sigma24 family protein